MTGIAEAQTWPGRVRAVVIGASAGGIEALMTLLPALPAGLRVPVFVVVHIPASQPSLLAAIFGPRCRVRVQEGEDKETVQAGTVYFAPPDYHLLVDRELVAGASPQLALSADAPLHFSRPAIDVLFESAAELYADGLLGIVLTGGSEDGAVGLACIHAAGGMALVQAPASAMMAAMPEFALRRCPAALVLPLKEIASLLSALPGGALP